MLRSLSHSFNLRILLFSSFIYDDLKNKFIIILTYGNVEFSVENNNWTTCDVEIAFRGKIYFMTFNINEKYKIQFQFNWKTQPKKKQQIGKTENYFVHREIFFSRKICVSVQNCESLKQNLKRKTQNIVPIKSSEKLISLWICAWINVAWKYKYTYMFSLYHGKHINNSR